jgi:hypothetical protein
VKVGSALGDIIVLDTRIEYLKPFDERNICNVHLREKEQASQQIHMPTTTILIILSQTWAPPSERAAYQTELSKEEWAVAELSQGSFYFIHSSS